MKKLTHAAFAVLLILSFFSAGSFAPAEDTAKNDKEKIVQAQIVLTVSESKRLIAKAVAQTPIVKKALKDGMVIITKGTTTTYVAEELLGRKIEHGAFIYGRVYPARGGKRPGFGFIPLVISFGAIFYSVECFMCILTFGRRFIISA